jgi:hypothetical protein
VQVYNRGLYLQLVYLAIINIGLSSLIKLVSESIFTLSKPSSQEGTYERWRIDHCVEYSIFRTGRSCRDFPSRTHPTRLTARGKLRPFKCHIFRRPSLCIVKAWTKYGGTGSLNADHVDPVELSLVSSSLLVVEHKDFADKCNVRRFRRMEYTIALVRNEYRSFIQARIRDLAP